MNSTERNVFVLVGAAGAGKTTLGKVLSQLKSFQVFDFDDSLKNYDIPAMCAGGEQSDEQILNNWLHSVEKDMRTQGIIILVINLSPVVLKKMQGYSFILIQADENLRSQRLQERIGNYELESILAQQKPDFSEQLLQWSISEKVPRVVNNEQINWSSWSSSGALQQIVRICTQDAEPDVRLEANNDILSLASNEAYLKMTPTW